MMIAWTRVWDRSQGTHQAKTKTEDEILKNVFLGAKQKKNFELDKLVITGTKSRNVSENELNIFLLFRGSEWTSRQPLTTGLMTTWVTIDH